MNTYNQKPNRRKDFNQIAHAMMAQVIARSEEPQPADSATPEPGYCLVSWRQGEASRKK